MIWFYIISIWIFLPLQAQELQDLQNSIDSLMQTEKGKFAVVFKDLVGTENVNKTMKAVGAKKIKVLRGVEVMKAHDAGLNNTTTAYDLMLIFENLGNGTAVDRASDKKMIDILLKQHHRDLFLPSSPKT